jgi:hypothetical protein
MKIAGHHPVEVFWSNSPNRPSAAALSHGAGHGFSAIPAPTERKAVWVVHSASNKLVVAEPSESA